MWEQDFTKAGSGSIVIYVALGSAASWYGLQTVHPAGHLHCWQPLGAGASEPGGAD